MLTAAPILGLHLTPRLQSATTYLEQHFSKCRLGAPAQARRPPWGREERGAGQGRQRGNRGAAHPPQQRWEWLRHRWSGFSKPPTTWEKYTYVSGFPGFRNLQLNKILYELSVPSSRIHTQNTVWSWLASPGHSPWRADLAVERQRAGLLFSLLCFWARALIDLNSRF